MKIWRAIFLNSVEELDINNFGCHWSKNEHYSNGTNFFYENISDFKRIGGKIFLFETTVSPEQIDNISTKKSNKDYPKEEECVLKRNTLLKEITLVNQAKKIKFKNINTGIRVCKWITE